MHTNIFLLLNSILYVLADSLIFSYYKYLIEFKYYYFLDILLAEGIIHFSFVLIAFFSLLLIQNINDSKTILSDFSDYYEEFGIGKILLLFFLNLIVTGFFIGFIDFLILKELTPNFVIIAYELARIPSSIIKNGGINRYIILIISLFQIIFLLFYLEIFEYNFCSLNKNTKRSISEREKNQIDYFNDDDSKVTIRGYDIPMENDNETKIEMGSEKGADNDNN